MTVASVFLEENGYTIAAREGEIARFGITIAETKIEIAEIAAWLRKHSKHAEK